MSCDKLRRRVWLHDNAGDEVTRNNGDFMLNMTILY